MSNDLIERLCDFRIWNNAHRRYDAVPVVRDAAQALTEARAEIERLNAQVDEALRSCLAEREGRLKAETAISTLRARVREVVGPFSRLDISHTDDIDDSALVFENEGGNIVLGHLRAARQLNEDLK